MGQSTIEYSIEGEGEPIVLIHGIGHRRQAWGAVPGMLKDAGYQVIWLDLPGHGSSPTPKSPAGYSMTSSAEQLEEFFAAIGLEKPHVVGNSLGGQMALELAARGSVTSAVAVSPAGFYAPYELALIGANLSLMKVASHAPERLSRAFADQERLRRISMRSLYVHPERLTADDAFADTLNMRDSKGFWPHFIRAIFLKYRGHPIVPTTIAWGDHDRLLRPIQARRAQQRLPEVTHVTLPDCGHCPMLDDPELLVRVIIDTIQRADAQKPTPEPADADVPEEGVVSVG